MGIIHEFSWQLKAIINIQENYFISAMPFNFRMKHLISE